MTFGPSNMLLTCLATADYSTWEILLTVLGVALVAATIADVVKTTLVPSGGFGLYSRWLCRGIWVALRTLARALPRGGPQLAGVAGPAMVIAMLLSWAAFLILGFALAVYPEIGGEIQAAGDRQVEQDFLIALYYSGYTFTTLGYGDIVPHTNIWRC